MGKIAKFNKNVLYKYMHQSCNIGKSEIPGKAFKETLSHVCIFCLLLIDVLYLMFKQIKIKSPKKEAFTTTDKSTINMINQMMYNHN